LLTVLTGLFKLSINEDDDVTLVGLLADVVVIAVFHGKIFVCFCGEPKETKEIILPAVVAGRLSDVGGNVVDDDDDDDDGVATHDVDAKSIL